MRQAKPFLYPIAMNQEEDNIGPLFARSQSPLGKLDHELKLKVDDETGYAFRARCAAMGTDVGSELRNMVYLVEHGKTYDEMVLERAQHEVKRRAAQRAGQGLVGAPDGAQIGGAV